MERGLNVVEGEWHPYILNVHLPVGLPAGGRPARNRTISQSSTVGVSCYPCLRRFRIRVATRVTVEPYAQDMNTGEILTSHRGRTD